MVGRSVRSASCTFHVPATSTLMLWPIEPDMQGLAPNRLPWQTGHVTHTSARSPSPGGSSRFPLAGHRTAPETLKLKPARRVAARLGLGDPGNKGSRILVRQSLIYVAGVGAGWRPIAIGRCRMTMSEVVEAPRSVVVQRQSWRIAPVPGPRQRLARMSPTSELFPEPDTPVTRRTAPAGRPRRSPGGCCAGSADREGSPVGGLALRGDGNRLLSER